ncbi:MAG: hypothetical protein HY053_07860 [Proteobacteria bacterium]|nr:hypothetical protein [Pseudomonadota bacterium]
MASPRIKTVRHGWRRVKNITRASGEIAFDMPRAVAIQAPGDWLPANDPGAAARLEAARQAQRSLLPVLRGLAQDLEDPPIGSATFEGELTVDITHRGDQQGGNQSLLHTSTKRRSGTVVLVPATQEFGGDLHEVLAGMFPAMELGQMSRALRNEVIGKMPGLRRRFKASEAVKVHVFVPEVIEIVERAIKNGEPVQHIAYSTGVKAYVPGEHHGWRKLRFQVRKAWRSGSLTPLLPPRRVPGSSLN